MRAGTHACGNDDKWEAGTAGMQGRLKMGKRTREKRKIYHKEDALVGMFCGWEEGGFV